MLTYMTQSVIIITLPYASPAVHEGLDRASSCEHIPRLLLI